MATPRLSDVATKIRKNKQFGFLATMLGETDIEEPTAGVDWRGVLLVNPRLAFALGTDVLVNRVRQEFKQAQELRQNVNHFH